MSIKLMTACYERSLAPHLRQVLLVLCDHANDFGESCHPSTALIAWKVEVSTRSVFNALQELERIGAISVDRRNGALSHYHIHLDRLPLKPPFRPTGEESSPVGEAIKTSEAHVTGETNVTGEAGFTSPVKPTSFTGEAHFTGPVKSTSPKPSRESSKNHQGNHQESAHGKRPMRLPVDFAVTEEMVAFATKELGLSAATMEFETSKFRDYWAAAPGSKGTKVDWVATWRNWMRSALERSPARASPPPNGTGNHFGPKGPDASWFAAEARRLEALGE